MNSLHVSRDAGLFAHCIGCHNVQEASRCMVLDWCLVEYSCSFC